MKMLRLTGEQKPQDDRQLHRVRRRSSSTLVAGTKAGNLHSTGPHRPTYTRGRNGHAGNSIETRARQDTMSNAPVARAQLAKASPRVRGQRPGRLGNVTRTRLAECIERNRRTERTRGSPAAGALRSRMLTPHARLQTWPTGQTQTPGQQERDGGRRSPPALASYWLDYRIARPADGDASPSTGVDTRDAFAASHPRSSRTRTRGCSEPALDAA